MQKRRFGIGTIFFVAIAFSLLSFLTTSVLLNNYHQQDKRSYLSDKSFVKKLSEIDDLVNSKFFFDIDKEAIEDMVMKGYVAGLGDQFTYYLSPEEAAMQNQSSSGEISGIGIYAAFDTERKGIYVTGVMPNSPAENAGLLPGDIIIQVGDIVVDEKTYNAAVYSVPGQAGTDVTLKIARYPEYTKTETMIITRQKVTIESISYEMLEGNIAYIKIVEFNSNSDEQFKEILKKAKTDGAKGIIFDVRNNPGGNLDSVCNILDPLLPKGPIVRIINKEKEVVQTIESDAVFTNLPMVVLMNRNTASGGELFSSALLDYKKATLVGETTFGKGCMQQLFSLSDGSMLAITTNLYSPPFGENYHGIGVIPTTKIEMSDEMMQKFNKLIREEDIQFQEALRDITEQINKK